MDTITHAQLRELAESGASPAISIFVPTHRAGSAVRQDPIELKNQLRDAETKLIENGMRGTEARDLLKPAQDLIDDTSIWIDGYEGLAIFISPGIFHVYGLPISPEAGVVVNDRFHVKPLLPILADHEFYILAVSQHDVRLLRCTRTSYERIPLPDDVETNIEQAVILTGEHSKTGRDGGTESGGAGRIQGSPGSPHSESVDPQHREAENLRFFLRQIDDGVRRAVPESDAALVLAGDINLTPTYREITKLKDIADESIKGNQDRTSNEVLHAKALEIVTPIWKKELAFEQENFGTALAQGKASGNVREIVLAAMDGRVNTLFISPKEQRWGRVSEENHSVELHESEGPGDEDLLDWATVRTLQTSGRVLVVERDAIPGDGPIAAVMRY
jgi:sporulation protein YlmC with PRC-barrel domain